MGIGSAQWVHRVQLRVAHQRVHIAGEAGPRHSKRVRAVAPAGGLEVGGGGHGVTGQCAADEVATAVRVAE